MHTTNYLKYNSAETIIFYYYHAGVNANEKRYYTFQEKTLAGHSTLKIPRPN